MADNDAPGCGQFGPQGHDWQELQRGLLIIASHNNIKALGLMVSEKKIFLRFFLL